MERSTVADEISWWHGVEEGAFIAGDLETMNLASAKLDEIVTDEALVQIEGEQ